MLVRVSPTILKCSLVAVIGRPGLIVGEAIMEPGTIIKMEMIESPN